jgi:hypothetical protein
MGLRELDNLVRTRRLKVEPAGPSEFEGLVRSGLARLKDAQGRSLSPESRFDLAYNAAHALALAALRWHGYRSESRYLVFRCLEHTLKLPEEPRRVLDQAHRKRNLVEYEGEVEINEQVLMSLLRVGAELGRRLSRFKPTPED